MNSNSLQKTVKIIVEKNEYEVPFPKTGEFIRIQILKAKLTEGFYDSLRLMERDGMIATVMIDAISTFTILVPQMGKDLLVASLLDLPLDVIIRLAYEYKDKYSLFHEQWMNLLSTPTEAKKEEATA